MNTLGDRLIVKFENNNIYKLGNGLELIKSELYHWEDGVSDNSMEGKVNKLEANPQVAEVIHNNPKHKLSKGDRVFLHYMAYEWKQEYHENGNDYEVVDANYVIFKINDDKIELVDNTYLGEVILESKLTLSGIIINLEDKRRLAEIRITHVPKRTEREVQHIKVGDLVKTIDDNQYIINFDGRKIVKLTADEIVALIV